MLCADYRLWLLTMHAKYGDDRFRGGVEIVRIVGFFITTLCTTARVCDSVSCIRYMNQMQNVTLGNVR